MSNIARLEMIPESLGHLAVGLSRPASIDCRSLFSGMVRARRPKNSPGFRSDGMPAYIKSDAQAECYRDSNRLK